ncbi:MAG: RNA-binding protein [Nitrospinaceae bacterium]|jgi:RNA recognition motif-containing protein|nr:MAG: RNA-binding protein [Nitrospinaceae bacterium]
MNLYAGNLPENLTETEIAAMFTEFGRVVHTELPRDERTGKPKGFALILMADKGEAERAKTALDGRRVGGKEIEVRLPRPKKTRTRYKLRPRQKP